MPVVNLPTITPYLRNNKTSLHKKKSSGSHLKLKEGGDSSSRSRRAISRNNSSVDALPVRFNIS